MGNKHSKSTTSTRYRVPFVDLQEATNNFDDKFVIGEGAFGKVYRGILCDGTKVAVKRCSPRSQQGTGEFLIEIVTLSRLRRPYLVSLIGYCDERNEKILVYEYMENGNLKRHLYGLDLPTLSWEQRLEICIGAARGLQYLHTSAVIHRYVKSTNILLLDDHFVTKITDFGLSKTWTELDETHVSTVIKGTFGYLNPEYYIRGKLAEKSDVYSFGAVLFEVLCARPAINRSLSRKMVNLVAWAMESQKNGQLERIIDPNLVGKTRPDSLRKFGETAVKFLAESGVDRLSTNEVLWNLEYALHLQEPVIQVDPEENSTIPIGEQITDFSHVDASFSTAQVKKSNSLNISSDEVISPR